MDGLSTLSAQVSLLTKRIQMREVQSQANDHMTQVISSDYCGVDHSSESVNYISNLNKNQNNPYSNTYNPGQRNHPNFVWEEVSLGCKLFNLKFSPKYKYKQPQHFISIIKTKCNSRQRKNLSVKRILIQFKLNKQQQLISQQASMGNLKNQIGQLPSTLQNQITQKTFK